MGFTAHIFSLLAIWLSSVLSEETEAYHGPIPLCSHSLSECFMSAAIKAVLIVSFFFFASSPIFQTEVEIMAEKRNHGPM